MHKKELIEQQVDAALNSADGAGQASPKPYLLTRIHARMNTRRHTVWEKAVWFLSRPAVAIVLCLVIVANMMLVVSNQSRSTVKTTAATAQADDFSYSLATIYDSENVQP